MTVLPGGGVSDAVRNGVILLAGDQQQRSPGSVPRVDLRRGMRGEVGERGLEQRAAGRGDAPCVMQLCRSTLRERWDRVGT